MAIYFKGTLEITHYFREQNQCEGMFENNFKEQGRS